jgi:His-Xaa-Ser system protein HxsD
MAAKSQDKLSFWKYKADSVDIVIPAEIYPKEPVFATCCVFLDEYYVLIDLDKKKTAYIVTLTSQIPDSKLKAKRAAQKFFNELLSNTLRYQVALRNQKIREYIVKEALFFSQPKQEQKKTVELLARSGKKNL